MKAPKTCNFDVKQQFEFNVSFSLEQKSNCGITDEVRSPGCDSQALGQLFIQEPNSISTMIMMQYHDSVITAKDRALKLICKYELASKTVSNFVELG